MLEQAKMLVDWFMLNGPVLIGIIFGLLAVAEAVVRLTPTKNDDTAVERVGTAIRRFFDMLGIKNRAPNGEVHPTVVEKAQAEDKAL